MTDAAIESATAALTAERSALAAELARMDAAHRQNRSELSGKLARLDRAITALGGKVTLTSARKPMSDEARQRIREGLLKANAAKKAATTTTPKSGNAQLSMAVNDEKSHAKRNKLVAGRKKPSRAHHP
jgi:hypothetical protein